MTDFASILNAWLAHTKDRVDLAEGTKRNYARVLRTLQEWCGDRAFAELSLTDFVRSRRRAGLADRTIHLELSILRIVVRWAEQERLMVLATPLRLPRLRIDPRQFRANHSTPTPEEAGLAIASMPRDDWQLAVALLARTGARVGEVVSLRSRDLDEHRGTLVLGAAVGNSKTGSRTFPLDPHSLRLLRGRGARGRTPLLDFGGVQNPKHGIRQRLQKACLKAGVQVFTPHGLRRMVVGRLIRACVDPGTAAALTGHTVTVMLRFYQVVTERDRRAATIAAQLGDLTGE